MPHNMLGDAGNINHFAEDFFVRFAVDTHFFMEISKFRAFRVLWQAFSAAYGVTDTPSIPIAGNDIAAFLFEARSVCQLVTSWQ